MKKQHIYVALAILCSLQSAQEFSYGQAPELSLRTGSMAPENLGQPLNAKISYRVADSYRIGVGDIMSVNVYPQDEFSTSEIIVRADGGASFPRIGELMVYGKSVPEVEQELSQLLNKNLKNHRVTVSLSSTRPAIFYLTGAVNKIGSFEMSTNPREQMYAINAETAARRFDTVLTNVLANAGGIKLNADLSKIQIKHRGSDDVQTVNLWKILRDGNANEDLWLSSGDSIHVPPLPNDGMMDDEDFRLLANSMLSPKSFPVRVIGEVKNASLIHMEGETPLLSTAIAQAGGFSPDALKGVVAIRRFTTDTNFSTIFVDTRKSDFLLRPNDVVYVGEHKLYVAGRFMQQAANVLSPFVSAAYIGGYSAQTFGFGGMSRINRGGFPSN